MISLTKQMVNKQKKPFFVKDKSHQEKRQLQTKKPLFVKDKFHQEKSQQTKKSLFSLMISLTKKKLNFKEKSPVFVEDKSHKEKLNFNTEN